VTPGIVAIGRNEGERLRRCLESLRRTGAEIVYVDSGSTDGSRELARESGAHVVELDLTLPFTAARARNAGYARLLEVAPAAEFVQFVDGDCELRPEWLEHGMRVLREHPDVAVVCGRRRERAPYDSVYNRLCDVEWDTPVGEAAACGGDALVRIAALRKAGAYDPEMIAGEEPELCLRLRRAGFRILRLDAEMTIHDAAISRWTQWWNRAVRTGHTTAELLFKHGIAPEHRRLRRALSAIFWGLALPLFSLGLVARAIAEARPFLLLFAFCLPVAAYALLLARVRRRALEAGRTLDDSRAWAVSCALSKWPELWGMALYLHRRLSGERARWIEYKDVPRGLAGARVAPHAAAPPIAPRRSGSRARAAPEMS
jgi:GT2 family glycosyltransferase